MSHLLLLCIVFADSLRLNSVPLEIFREFIFFSLNSDTMDLLPIFLLFSLIIVSDKLLDLGTKQLIVIIHIDW
jgi:hypothetical protein